MLTGLSWATRWRWLTAIAIVALMACVSSDEIPPLERQAHQINQSVMCPVCPGESIDQSQHPLALQMRAIVAEKLEEGWSGDQIRAFFRDRYGPSVLLEPPRKGFNLLVWVAPPIGLAIAVVFLYLALRTMGRTGNAERKGAEPSVTLTEEERAVYFPRILAHDGDQPSVEVEGRAPHSRQGGGP